MRVVPSALAIVFCVFVRPLLAAKPGRELVLQAAPALAVNSVTLSPEGALVATAAGEGGVRLYDARNGRLLRVIGQAGDRGVVFSPDGKTLTAAGFHMDKLVALWDVQSGKRLRTFEGQTEWEADATAISPDGKLLASTATDKQILVWELATGKLIHQLKNQPFRVAALAFSPDSATLAAAGGDKLVRLFDARTGSLVRSLQGHNDWVCAIAFSPDGQTIASVSCDWGFHRGHAWPRPIWRGPEQSELKIWEIATGKLQRTASQRGRMLTVAFAPGGKSLAYGIDSEVRLCDVASEGPGRTIARHDALVASVAFTPDGAALVSGSHDHTVKRINLATGAVEWQAPGYFEQVNSVALSADATLLATGSSDYRFGRGALPAGNRHIGPGAVRLWDLRSGRMLRRLGDPAEQVMAVALSSDGRRIACGGGASAGKGIVRVWDASSGAQIWSVNEHAKEVLAIALAPDGASLAAAAADGLVKIHDAQTGAVTRTLADHQGGATAVLFSADGTLLYCGEAHGGTRVWDARSGQLRLTCKAGSLAITPAGDRLMNSIGLSRDGTLATCNSSINNEFVDRVRLWDARTGELKRDFAPEKTHGRPMAFSPDGSIIATGGKSVQLWDARTGQKLRQLFGHLKRTQSIAFSDDGRLIVSGGSYGTTNLWDVTTGRHLATLFSFIESNNGTATDDWLVSTPDGFYDGSSDVDRFLAWRVGDDLHTPNTLKRQLHRPDLIEAALKPDSATAGRP